MSSRKNRPFDQKQRTNDPSKVLERASRAASLHEQNIRFAAKLISDGHHKYDIKRRLQTTCGLSFSPKNFEMIMSAARTMLAIQLGKTREEHRGESLDFYLRLSRDPAADPQARLRARERVDKLLGLEAATKSLIEVSVDDMAARMRAAVQSATGSIPAEKTLEADFEVVHSPDSPGSPPAEELYDGGDSDGEEDSSAGDGA